MRRGTLIVIVVLIVLILGAALYQVTLGRDERRVPSTTSTAVVIRTTPSGGP